MQNFFEEQKNKFRIFMSRNMEKMKLFKNCPFFVSLVITGLLFTIIGVCGRGNVYAGQEYDPVRAPILSVVFAALNDDIYPWQVFIGGSVPTVAKGQPPLGEMGGSDAAARPEINFVQAAAQMLEKEAETKTDIAQERLEPLRESTREEYLNHISADIYGDAGVVRAASFEFSAVDESYFDDAVFIGDSRTVGLRDYTDLSDHADFFCETSLSIYEVMEEDFEGMGTVEDALKEKDYGKIYLMVGINELGRGTTENFIGKYTEVVDWLHGLEPDAKIFVQGIMRVTGKKNSSDDIFNNNNINARNNAIATLADNKRIFYIDVNEVVCDEEGNLNSEYTHDQIHLLGAYNDLWKQFLLAHGVVNQ